MNRPSGFARLAAYPPMTILLFIGYAYLISGWYLGRISWWIGIAAIAAAVRTLGAVKRVRVYKAWLAEWQAMSGHDAPPRPRKNRLRGWVLGIGALFIAVAIPLLAPPGTRPSDALTVIWCLACLYLVFALLRRVLRRMGARRKVKAEVAKAKAEAAPVAWLVDRPSSSASRAEAERNLPDYCARLISRAH
jgi:hypothetical protein